MSARSLTITDRADAKLVAARFAELLYREPNDFVTSGEIPMTQEMLAHLMEEVYRTGYLAGLADARGAS